MMITCDESNVNKERLAVTVSGSLWSLFSREWLVLKEDSAGVMDGYMESCVDPFENWTH